MIRDAKVTQVLLALFAYMALQYINPRLVIISNPPPE
jgi:hypothetical protein